MNTVVKKTISCLTEQSKKIFRGDFSDVDKIYNLEQKDKNGQDVTELIENFGLMAVKLEAREISLTQKIKELEEKQTQLNLMSQLRTDSTYIFLSLISVVSIFSFLLVLVQSIDNDLDKKALTFTMSRASELVFIMLFLVFRISRKMPLSEFGLNTRNLGRSIYESIAVSLGVMALISLVKYVLIENGSMEAQSIFTFGNLNWTYLTYILVAPLQEFVARGVGQTSIQRVLTGKYAWLESIFVTALIFGLMHLTISLSVAVLSFGGSLIWGYLFYRQGNIIGISISHFLIGVWLGMSGLLY